MIAIILWLYGGLAIASLTMVVSWGQAARKIFQENINSSWGERRWNRPLIVSGAMAVHSWGMCVGTTYRTWDIFHGINVDGSEISILLLNMFMIFMSKVVLIWAISIVPDKHEIRWPWWTFLFFMIFWGGLVWGWGTGLIDLQ